MSICSALAVSCSKQFDLLARVLVTDGGVLAGAGFNLGAVDAHGANLLEPGTLLRHEQNLHEGFLKEIAVLATEGADGVVVGMQVAAAEIANYHVFVGCVLDHARGEAPSGVAIDEQGKHHAGWILFIARSSLIGAEVFCGESIHRIDDEMDDVVTTYPVAQIRRQEHRGLSV